MTIEEKNIPLEYYKNNQDAIRKAVYEKCSRGEITLAQREQVLGVLNEYVEASETILDKFINVFENYMEDKLTDEEFDTIAESYMEEQPEMFHTIFGDDILKRSIMLKECVQMVYEEGGVDREEGKSLFHRIDEMVDTELERRVDVLDNPDIMMESAYEEKVNPAELGEGFLTVADHIVLMEENGELSREACHQELLRMVNEYCDTIMVESKGSSAGKAVKTGLTIAAIAATILLIKAAISRRSIDKPSAKRVVSIYEKLKEPKIKTSELKFKKTNPVEVIRKYFGGGHDINALEDPTVVAYLVTYHERPFAVLIGVDDKHVEVVDDPTNPYGGKSTRTTMTTERDFKLLNISGDAKKHQDFYRMYCMSRIFDTLDKESTVFLKYILGELTQIQKEQKKLEQLAKKEKKEASKSTSKVTKEFTEHTEGQDLFESVEREIYARYNRGEYTLDQREELLMEARNRYFTGE